MEKLIIKIEQYGFYIMSILNRQVICKLIKLHFEEPSSTLETLLQELSNSNLNMNVNTYLTTYLILYCHYTIIVNKQ